MDEKFRALAELVREARLADKAAFARMETARAEWKSANDSLTERLKVFDGYVDQLKAAAIRMEAQP